MSWIKIISYEAATGQLKRVYDKIKGADNYIDNILKVHSLRPNTLVGHMALYKNVLHHQQNTIPKWFLETLGVYVSMLNECDYCIDHHFTGLQRILKDEEKAMDIKSALQKDIPEILFQKEELALLRYAKELTIHPGKINEKVIQTLREEGLDDGQILEANQVICYFCYANRTVLGLGVTTEGEILGLSPNDDSDVENWHHK